MFGRSIFLILQKPQECRIDANEKWKEENCIDIFFAGGEMVSGNSCWMMGNGTQKITLILAIV